MSFLRPSPLLSTPPLAPLSQSQLYADVLRAMGRDLVQLPLGDLTLATLLLRRIRPFGPLALLPGGPIWPPGISGAARAACLADLPRLARTAGARLLLTSPDSRDDAARLAATGHLPLITGQHVARLDLSPSPEARRAALHGKWRNRLAHARSADLRVIRSRFELARHDWLLRAESQQRRARGYHALPLDFAAMAAALAPDQCHLFQARYRGHSVAAMLFLLHGRVASYHIGHTTALGRRLSAHNLLLWQAASWLADRGYDRLDLGPVDTETPAAAGLARFKLGSGAAAIQLGATCLHSPLTAPLGRAATALTRRPAAHVVAGQTGRSCR